MIQVQCIAKGFGRVRALDGLSLGLERGETLVVLGPSGCGKTTLLRLIAGLERPDAGEILIDGRRVSSPGGLVDPHRRGLSMIFQDLALWPHLSAFEHVAFGLRGRGRSRESLRALVIEALRQVSLQDHLERYPHELSGGERQRLAIARALAASPQHLLMDEPFSSLDPLLKRRMMDLLGDLRSRLGLGVLYVTHQLDEALALGDRILLMGAGRVLGSLGRDRIAALTQSELLAWYASLILGESAG